MSRHAYHHSPSVCQGAPLGFQAIISVSPMQPEKGNYCLATYRGQESNNRVEIRMRVVEGHYGTVQVRPDSERVPTRLLTISSMMHFVDESCSLVLGESMQAFIVPRLAPKTCQICTYRVRPLCLQVTETAPAHPPPSIILPTLTAGGEQFV
jgi:hypothetical protein